jgi:hypothetical protein
MSIKDPREKIKNSLNECFQGEVEINYIGPLDKELSSGEDLKEFGYGENLLVEFTMEGNNYNGILSSLKENIFGHQFFYDRAKSILLAHSTYDNLPHHVKSIDVLISTKSNDLKSIGDIEEFFLLREKVDGDVYNKDLERIQNTGKLKTLDKERTKALADYLVQIHKKKSNNSSYYLRRIRDLIGHGECIMGLTDSYTPDLKFTNYKELREIEKKCIDWRYKLKTKTHRLSQVHGDFHQWNILFREGTDFTLLDRSRGEWGEPADDVSCLSINYLFYALLTKGSARDRFLNLFDLFWRTYLQKSNDNEILSVIGPFFAWRALVLASPIWYPDLKEETRRKMFNFIHNVLDQETFDIETRLKLFEKQ